MGEARAAEGTAQGAATPSPGAKIRFAAGSLAQFKVVDAVCCSISFLASLSQAQAFAPQDSRLPAVSAGHQASSDQPTRCKITLDFSWS